MMWTEIIQTAVPLVVALALMMKASFLMIEKKNIFMYAPFFALGFVLIFSASFTLFGIMEDAAILHRMIRIGAYFTILYILWRLR